MTDISKKEKKNYAYFNLVDQSQPNDFIGMVAYSLYKKSKVEYIQKYRKEHSGKSPDEETMNEWQKSQCTPQQVELYKTKSTKIIALFVNDIIAKKHNEIIKKEDLYKQRSDDIEKKDNEISEKERLLKKREIEIRIKEEKVKQMEKICPANKNKLGLYFIAVSQSLVATLIYILITIIIFIQLKWPIDLIKNIRQILENSAK